MRASKNLKCGKSFNKLIILVNEVKGAFKGSQDTHILQKYHHEPYKRGTFHIRREIS